ncbi:hypothetical protein MUK42_04836 [Musa troglodytarum]|uniref:Uncharacterized protein n=1 Tax=Musa troglodytarum TaxID=320322 RepID=A0A9E7GFD7_9LILI|nr:hypothetical protein MUK42_04836 [Musa troglodytarum]
MGKCVMVITKGERLVAWVAPFLGLLNVDFAAVLQKWFVEQSCKACAKVHGKDNHSILKKLRAAASSLHSTTLLYSWMDLMALIYGESKAEER